MLQRLLSFRRALSSLIYDVVYKQGHQYLIIINKVKEALKKALNVLDIDLEIFELVTFINEKGEFIHIFPDFRGEAAQPSLDREIEEVETWYQFYLEDFEEQHMDKDDFFKEKNIPESFQAFVYTKDEKGNIDGIVFQGYSSRIDRDLALARQGREFWWGTRRPVKVDNLQKEMWVYVVETDIDRDTGKRVEKPKLRVKGRLREVYKARGKEKEKIFPFP